MRCSAAASTARDLENIEVGDHDPQQRGFNARNIELAFDGAVDPYFEGFANIVFKLDNDNETEVEVEEAFMQTTSLPFDLQLKARTILRRRLAASIRRIRTHGILRMRRSCTDVCSGRMDCAASARKPRGRCRLPWYSQLIVAVQNGEGEHRLFIPQSRRRRHVLRSPND